MRLLAFVWLRVLLVFVSLARFHCIRVCCSCAARLSLERRSTSSWIRVWIARCELKCVRIASFVPVSTTGTQVEVRRRGFDFGSKKTFAQFSTGIFVDPE